MCARSVVLLLAAVMLVGCRTSQPTGGSSYYPVGPTPLEKAKPLPAEADLLDIAVSVFSSETLEAEAVQAQHTSKSIRNAEKHYMPQQLKLALDDSRYWGEVRVLPFIKDGHGFDIIVSGHIAESSNGRTALDVTATDATGRQWMSNSYVIQLRPVSFLGKDPGEPAQDLYSRIANDLVQALRGADTTMRNRIRKTSRMAFAARVSPEPFAEYLGRGPSGQVTLRHFPADQDPAWQRINKIHGRDRVFSELVNKHYDTYHKQMEDPYTGWRREIVSEREALRQTRKEGWKKAMLGAALIGSAIALEVAGVENAGAAKVMLGAAGVQQVASGVSALKQQKMHRLALEELTESFSAAADPIVIDFEGQQVELQGTADEQYERWQGLLQEMYRQETSFPDEDASLPSDP